MTPNQLAKNGTEHGHQVALFAYVACAHLHGFAAADRWVEGGARPPHPDEPAMPALKWLHAIPNGGARGDGRDATVRGANLKAEGVRAGVADVFLPVPRNGWHGLYIEMKKPSLKPVKTGRGGLSDEQLEFRDYARMSGYGWVVCYSWEHAVEVLKQYLGMWGDVKQAG